MESEIIFQGVNSPENSRVGISGNQEICQSFVTEQWNSQILYKPGGRSKLNWIAISRSTEDSKDQSTKEFYILGFSSFTDLILFYFSSIKIIPIHFPLNL